MKLARRERMQPSPRSKTWAKAVRLAYLLLLGDTQADACRDPDVAIASKTATKWRRCPWWKLAEEEARERWMQTTLAHARGAVQRGAKDDHRFALTILQRAGEIGGDGVSEEKLVQIVIELAHSVALNVTDEDTLRAIHEGWQDVLRRHQAPTAALEG